MTDIPQEPRDLIQICTDIYYECETIKRLDELTTEALDWHNKQVEEVLDRLEAEKLDLPTTPVDSHGYPQGGIQRIYPFIPLLAIEAERNKLKESN